MSTFDRIDARTTHHETNPLTYSHTDVQGEVHLSDPNLAEITRIRYLSDPDFPAWDLSYVHGRLSDGTLVSVTGFPFQLPKPRMGRTGRMYGAPIKALIGFVQEHGLKCYVKDAWSASC